MYNVSNNSTIQQWYKDAVYNPNRRLKLEFYINDTLVDNAYLLDKIELEYDTMQDGYTVGNIVYSKLSFSLYSGVTIFEMANITIKIGVEVYNTDTSKYEYITIPFGQYKVVDIESTKLRHKITAYDKCYNQLQMPFVKTKNEYTSGEIINQISSETGIQFENFPTDVVLANEDIVTKTQDAEGTEVEERKPGTNFDNHTYATILSQVAGVCGGNIIFSREGKCKLVVGLPQSDVAVLSQDYTEPTIKPFTYDKKRLEIAKREDLQPIKVGSEVVTSNQTLGIANPLFTTDSANRVLDVIDDISYQPISTKIIVMPLHLEPLDIISIVYEDVTYKLPLQKFKMTFIGSGLTGEMESFVSNQTQNNYQGSLTSQVSNLTSQVANMNKLVVGSLVVGDLEALSIKVDELTANVIKVNQLIANGITADQIQSYNLTSKNTTIENGLIKDAMIMNVNADKILAGKIDTGSVTIGSEDGSLTIADETIQISDGSHVRVQIGQDAQGDYNLYVWDSTGALMWNALGLTEDAIKSAIIRDDMVSDEANINAKKLDIQSLFTVINEDGSNTLKASKIFLDTEQQTLNIAFNTMTEKQELLTEITDTHTTQLNTQQGQIDTLIKNTTIEDDGETTTLKDAYSQFVQTQDGFNVKVEEKISTFEEDINSIETRVSSAEQKITEDAIISTVSSTFVKQTDFDNMTIGGENLIVNSDFEYGFEKWKGSTTQFELVDDNYYSLKYTKTDLTEAKNYQVATQPITVLDLVGKELTLTFDYKIIDKSVQSTTTIAYVRFFDADHEDSSAQADSIAHTNVYYPSDYTNNKRATSTTTVTVPTGAKYVRVGAYQAQNGDIRYSKFQLEVGNKPTAWKPNSQDTILNSEQTTQDIVDELKDLTELVELNNGSDALTLSIKQQFVAEFKDATAVYTSLVGMYTTLNDTTLKDLYNELVNDYNALKTYNQAIVQYIETPEETGLAYGLERFSEFYDVAERLNQAIINSLKGVTDKAFTEIEQLSNSINMQVSAFNTQLGQITTRFIFDTSGLTIKSTANATKYMKLDNDSLDFMDNGTKVAEITNQQLNISKATITSEMKIGNMKIKPSGSSKNGVVFVFE